MRRRFMNISNSVPLSFEALEDGLSISFLNEILYCINGGAWKTLLAGENTEEVNKGSVISFQHSKSISSSGVGKFSINKKCNAYGTCSSIIPEVFGEKHMTYRLFYGLFKGCDTIVDASKLELPATTLAEGCYYEMFEGCTSLISAPELPATTLASSCYYRMFYGCSNLNYIKAMFTTTPSSSYTSNWVYGVASTGTFVKNKNATWNVTGVNGVPSGWTVVNDGEESGGKIVNHGIITGSSPLSKVQFEYPVTSSLAITLSTSHVSSTQVLVFKGATSASLGLGPGETIVSVISIEPREDDTYIYELVI